MRSLLLSCSLLVVTAGPLAAQDTVRVSGCYRFDRAYFQWVGRGPNRKTVFRDSTRVLRLAPNAVISHELVRGAVLDVYPVPFVADSSTTRRWLRPSHWTFVDRSTLNIVWRNGLYGPVFRLSIAGDSLYGRVRFTTDVAGAEPRAESAWAVRIPCPK
jgi:hypothetical protein